MDADIKGAFDNIDHSHLLGQIGNFPARELIRQWLKAGYVDKDVFHDTERGTPQGGVLSPLLANIALDGMEKHLTALGEPRTVVRYADDFVVLCATDRDAGRAHSELGTWLRERGLEYSADKTRLVHVTDGFDFLGVNVRLYESTQSATGTKLLIKPSDDSVRSIREKLRKEWYTSVGKQPLSERIPVLNRIIRGWANYHKHVVAVKTFHKLDKWMYKREQRYTKRMHKEKSARWRKERYWGTFNAHRADHWVFGDKHTGQYVWKFSWTGIKRHRMVRGTASPDDPELKEYWERRTAAKTEGLPLKKQRIARNQDHLCPVCGEDLHNGEEIQVHHVDPKGGDAVRNLQLVHLYCHQQITAKQRKGTKAT